MLLNGVVQISLAQQTLYQTTSQNILKYVLTSQKEHPSVVSSNGNVQRRIFYITKKSDPAYAKKG